MKKFFNEFKEFAIKGNALSMAIGVIIGSAFSAIVSSIVNDLFMPLIGFITGGIDISSLSVSFGDGEHAATIAYGTFLNNIVDFLIVAILLFLLVKGLNALRRKKEEPAAPAVFVCPFCRETVDENASKCPHCASEITPVKK